MRRMEEADKSSSRVCELCMLEPTKMGPKHPWSKVSGDRCQTEGSRARRATDTDMTFSCGRGAWEQVYKSC